jgi:hypothetical protein
LGVGGCHLLFGGCNIGAPWKLVGNVSGFSAQLFGTADQCFQPEPESGDSSVSAGPRRITLPIAPTTIPQITANPSAARNRFSNNRPPQTSIFNGITFSDFTVPVDLSYQVNAWGRVSRRVESFREQAQASAADLAVVNLSLHASLAIDYFAARTLDAEEQLLKDTVAHYEQALQLNVDRYEGGLASEVEVEQARTILETTRAQMIDVGVARAQFEHGVAILIGKPPADFSLPPLPLTTPPPPIPVGVPSELLETQVVIIRLGSLPVPHLLVKGRGGSRGNFVFRSHPAALTFLSSHYLFKRLGNQSANR